MAAKLNPARARDIELHFIVRETGEVDRVETFRDCRPPQKVADDLNQLCDACGSKYRYVVPEESK